MKFLMGYCLFLAIILGFSYAQANFTCWDICKLGCKAKFGTLTNQCVKTCGCTCNKECENFCMQYSLGWNCRFKCGCYQNYTFGVDGMFKLCYF